MADEVKNGPVDPTRVDIDDSYELVYWAGYFFVSTGRLTEAVQKVGFNVEDVKAELAKDGAEDTSRTVVV